MGGEEGTKARRRAGTRALLACVAALSVAAAAPGQDSFVVLPQDDTAALPDPGALNQIAMDPSVEMLARQLGSESYPERESATRALLEGNYNHDQLYVALQRLPLDAEQRHRLLEVVRRRLLNAPRGAVGISMRELTLPGRQNVEVEVIDLIPGLPAERVLHLGDRIFEVDGRIIEDQNDLVRYVQQRVPGDSIQLVVRRAARDDNGRLLLDQDERKIYRTLEVELVLGSAELLRSPDGRPARESSVVRERRQEAEAAAARYGPTPGRIAMRTGQTSTFAPDSAALPEQVVDQDPVIHKLKTERQLVRAGRLQMNDTLRDRWQRELEQLVQQSRRPGLGPDERAYRQRVAERFRELLEAGD